MVFQTGLEEGPKGIPAGCYVKPAVQLIQDLRQATFGVSLGPFDRDSLLLTPAGHTIPQLQKVDF